MRIFGITEKEMIEVKRFLRTKEYYGITEFLLKLNYNKDFGMLM